MYDKQFNAKFETFLKKFNLEKQIPYIDGIISCDGDKVQQYFDLFDKNHIPHDIGAMIYFISKCNPYSNVARVKMPIDDFMVNFYQENQETLNDLISEEQYRSEKDIELDV